MPSITLKEFACAGINLRTGTQIILWIVLLLCVIALQEINSYYYETKKAKLTESPLTILILDIVYGIMASLSGLYGAYHNKRIWIKQFFIYLMSQFAFMGISIWIYYIYVYPTQPPNPKKTRFIILTTIWLALVVGGLLMYSTAIVYSYYKELGISSDDRQFLVREEQTHFPVSNDRYQSDMCDAMSSVSTSRSYYTINENAKNPRFTNNFGPAIPEETQKSFPEVIQKLNEEPLLD